MSRCCQDSAEARPLPFNTGDVASSICDERDEETAGNLFWRHGATLSRTMNLSLTLQFSKAENHEMPMTKNSATNKSNYLRRNMARVLLLWKMHQYRIRLHLKFYDICYCRLWLWKDIEDDRDIRASCWPRWRRNGGSMRMTWKETVSTDLLRRKWR